MAKTTAATKTTTRNALAKMETFWFAFCLCQQLVVNNNSKAKTNLIDEALDDYYKRSEDSVQCEDNIIVFNWYQTSRIFIFELLLNEWREIEAHIEEWIAYESGYVETDKVEVETDHRLALIVGPHLGIEWDRPGGEVQPTNHYGHHIYGFSAPDVHPNERLFHAIIRHKELSWHKWVHTESHTWFDCHWCSR